MSARASGIHDVGYGGIVIGARYGVPSLKHFQSRHAVNRDILKALEAASVRL